MITIYHNTRCSKSREALSLVEQLGARHQLLLEIIDYQNPPLTVAQLSALQKKLDQPVSAMVRSNEIVYKTLGLAQANDDTLLKAIANHPRLLQRPIVEYQNRAVIARPADLVNTLFLSP